MNCSIRIGRNFIKALWLASHGNVYIYKKKEERKKRKTLSAPWKSTLWNAESLFHYLRSYPPPRHFPHPRSLVSTTSRKLDSLCIKFHQPRYLFRRSVSVDNSIRLFVNQLISMYFVFLRARFAGTFRNRFNVSFDQRIPRNIARKIFQTFVGQDFHVANNSCSRELREHNRWNLLPAMSTELPN